MSRLIPKKGIDDPKPSSFVTGVLVFMFTCHLEASELQRNTSFLSLSVTDHLLITNRRDLSVENKFEGALMHEDSIQAQYKEMDFGIQFANRFDVGIDEKGSQAFVLEKKYVKGEWERWGIALGDSHQELGRGIALSLYRDEIFGFDHTLEGMAIQLHSDVLESTLFTGRINTLDSPVAVNSIADPLRNRNMYLAGGSSSWNLTEVREIGGHYLFAMNVPDSLGSPNKRWHTLGITYREEDLANDLATYLESNLLVSQNIKTSEVENQPLGMGTYGSVVWFPDPWKAKLELKDYRFYSFEFRKPPSLEEDIVLSTNMSDVTASRLGFERKLKGSIKQISASYLLGDDRHEEAILHHAVFGTKIELPWETNLELKTGYRTVTQRSKLTHFSAKTKTPTWKAQTLELGYRKQVAHLNLHLLPGFDDRNIFDLTYSFSEKLSSTLGYEYLPESDPSSGNHFFNIGASLKMGELVGRVFLGQTSGGTLCSGGVCREVPPYSGALLETTYSF